MVSPACQLSSALTSRSFGFSSRNARPFRSNLLLCQPALGFSLARPATTEAILAHVGVLRRELVPVNAGCLLRPHRSWTSSTKDVLPIGDEFEVVRSNTSGITT